MEPSGEESGNKNQVLLKLKFKPTNVLFSTYFDAGSSSCLLAWPGSVAIIKPRQYGKRPM